MLFANTQTNIDKAAYVKDVLGPYFIQMKQKRHETFT